MSGITHTNPFIDSAYPGSSRFVMPSSEWIDKTFDNFHSLGAIIQRVIDFGTSENLEQLLQDILDQMAMSLNAWYAFILTLDRNQKQVHTVVTYDTLMFTQHPVDIVDILKLVSCLVKKNRTADFTELIDEAKWKNFKPEEQNRLREIICAPLVIHHKTMGLVCLCGEDSYSEKLGSESFLLWSGLVALAIEKYQNIHQKHKRQEFLGKELKKAQIHQIRSEKLHSMAEIAMSVEHAIRNPVTVIGGLSRRIYKSLSEDDLLRERIQIIISEALRLESIVNEFKRFFPIKEISLQSMDINRLVNEAADSFLDQYDEQRDFVLKRQIHNDSLICWLDPDLFVRSMMHLLANARESCGSDVEITLSTSRAGRHAVIDVIDTGKGMSPKEMNRIFDPFYTTKGQGAGLGLTFVHFVICEHEGQIDLTSKEGAGTRFRIILPLVIPN